MRIRWWLVLPASCVLLAGVIVLLGPFCREMATQAALMVPVERRIGAEIRAPSVKLGDKYREVITICEIAPGGPCDRADFREGDIVVEDVTIGQLYRRLNGPSGKPVSIEVVEGGDGPPMDERQRRRVTLVLP